MGTDKYPEVPALDNLYMLDVDEPSEAARSPYSPTIDEHLEAAREAIASAKMLGMVVILGFTLTLLGIALIVWRVVHHG